MIIALLAEIAGLVIIFSIAHFSSHDLSSALKQRLTACDLRFSKNPVNCVKYNADRLEAVRSIAELSNLSEALNHGTAFLLAFPIVSVLAAFSLDVRKKEQIKKVKQIEKGQDNEFVFFEETSKLLFFFCFSLPVLLLTGCCVLGKSWTQETMLWICSQSLSIVLYCFPITALILLALLFVKDRAPKKFKWSYMLAFVPLVPTVLAIVWGGFWHSESQSPLFVFGGRGCSGQILEVIFWSFCPLALLALYAYKGHRIFCLVVLICEFWFLLCAYFTATEAVTGSWL